VPKVDDKGCRDRRGPILWAASKAFRFRPEQSSNPDEARTLRQAAAQALAPQFHLRADRFYNAPDTEIDFTEQGGLMWGEHAVGRLAKGPEPLRPDVMAFVDEEAAPEVAQKVLRRLQHFIDRKVAASMEPLLALQRDEALTGLARGFAYRLVENLGIIPRGDVAEEVKQLDPEARAALRRHGIRLGQFTVFQPALLKPAPTRLRLVLWSLWKGLDEFPSSPPPGHVTVPAQGYAPQGFWAMAGYRAAGERAIRIDMLERLADLLRERDSRQGFEAVPEMLSITGLSLEQFAKLMEGLGYRAERAERPKVRTSKAAPAAQALAVRATPAVAPEGSVADTPADSVTAGPAEAPVAASDTPDPGTPSEAPTAPPVEEPARTPEETPAQPPSEDPAPIPETPPGQPAEVPDLPARPRPHPTCPGRSPSRTLPRLPTPAPSSFLAAIPSRCPTSCLRRCRTSPRPRYP
jgi:ATP-dependent RNA helicase SUPV3L1/SUV3